MRRLGILPGWSLRPMDVLAVDVLAAFAEYLGELSRWALALSGPISAGSVDTMKANLNANEVHALSLGLELTSDQIIRIKATLVESEVTAEAIRPLITELANRFRDELGHRLCLIIPRDHAKWFGDEQQPFGPRVAERLPKATIDIEEAAKCLALGRGTACVFHLMRTMEVGLKAIAFELGIPYAPSWESYIRQIQDKLDIAHKKKARKWKAQEPFFRDVLAHLHAVKVAWRNPTMHIVNHYTPEQAESVFNAVRGFLQHLAENLSEPKAKPRRRRSSDAVS